METDLRKKSDWAGNTGAFALAWVLPVAAMVAAVFAPAPIRTVIWVVSLVWMGTACLANASRCGRLHCYFTGPFHGGG